MVRSCYHFKHYIFENNNSICICGGKSIELIEAGLKPYWFDQFNSAYAVGSQIKNPLHDLFGAGMAIRRKIFEHFRNINFNFSFSPH